MGRNSSPLIRFIMVQILYFSLCFVILFSFFARAGSKLLTKAPGDGSVSYASAS